MLYALARHGRELASEVTTLANDPALSDEGAATLLRAVALVPSLARLKAPLSDRLRSRLRVEATTADRFVANAAVGLVL